MMSEIMEQYNREAVDENNKIIIKKMLSQGYSIEQVLRLFDSIPRTIIEEIYASVGRK
ncbi:MAG: hypothetical protein II092_09465 [Lachnospiraceae bacterium]|nr:hypothetical protein [Lachnospiraceae bacterium]